MKNIKYCVAVIFATISTFAFAQPGSKPSGGGIDNQSQEVIKNFDARLIDAEKLKLTPFLPAVDTSTKAQGYNVQTRSVRVDYVPPKLRPVAVKADALPVAYNGYIKAGYGLPSSPYAEAAYHLGSPKVYNLDLKAKYHAADYKELANQRFSIAGGSARGSYFLNQGLAIDGNLGYQENTNYLYGYDHAKDSISSSAARQSYSGFDVGAKIYNTEKTVADINYSLGLNFANYTDNFGSKETTIDLRGEATKWFDDKHPLTLVLRTDFNNYDSSGTRFTGSTVTRVNQEINNIYIQPSFTFHGDIFKVKLGLNLVSYKDEFYPMPDIEATLNLAGNSFALYGGWRGDFIKNSFRNLSAYNPYVASAIKVGNTQVTEYYGGIKGSFAGFDYQAQAGYSDNKKLALFLSDSTDRVRRFNVLYDTVGIFNIRGTVSFRPIPSVEFTGTVSQNVYTPKKEAAAWGLPSLDLNLGAKYTIQPEVAFVKASFFVQNGVNIQKADKTADRLGGLFDFNLGFEYWFAKNIGAFVDLNNLFNNKRERWLNYPIYGLNVLGGVTARF
jgi:hypothetical protein